VQWPAGTTNYWYYDESTVSKSGLSIAATLSDIRDGDYNMTNGVNNCGRPEDGWTVRSWCQGDTNVEANIGTDGHCTYKFPDGVNSVSWGTLPHNFFAFTCFKPLGKE
jgi:hypothetical protein